MELFEKLQEVCRLFCIKGPFLGYETIRVGNVNKTYEVKFLMDEGFLEKTAGTLTQDEIDTLALSCFCLAVELATRFLADYLDGDKYFKTDYPDHNLVRTRCQIALAKDMQKKLPQMEAIVRECMAR